MPHGISIFQKDIQVASLDHQFGFMIAILILMIGPYSQKSPKTSGNRGFAEGMKYLRRKFNRDCGAGGMIRKISII